MVNMAGNGVFDYDICIVGLKCWGKVSGSDDPRYIGGVETDLVTLARLLVAEGKRVALIVYDEGQPAVVDIDGISVFRSFSASAGWPGLRFLIPRATGLFRSVGRIHSRYVLQMGSGVETGWTAIAAKWLSRRRKFVFLAASDTDCMASLPRIEWLRERLVYRLGLKLADRVFAQTDLQADLLKREFGISADVLRLLNAFRLETSSVADPVETHEVDEDGCRKVLWVGRTDSNKRPHWLLELAETYPGYRFDIAGKANSEDEYARSFRDRAAKFDNVVLHGVIQQDELARLYRAADVLCCTSEFEGFPTVFLEAWSYGLPTISTVDPGKYLSRYRPGTVVKSVDELRSAISPDSLSRFAREWSTNAEQLYVQHFSPQVCLRTLNDALARIA